MLQLYGWIEEAVAVIRSRWQRKPHAGIVLGTGLGGLVEQIEVEASFEYGEIPHFLQSTATSHRGRLVCGLLNGLPVVAMEGRFHMYEGYSLQQITFPVRVMKALSVVSRREDAALLKRDALVYTAGVLTAFTALGIVGTALSLVLLFFRGSLVRPRVATGIVGGS